MELTAQEFEQLTQELCDDGYKMQPPPGAQDDALFACNTSCDDCGGECKYEPYSKLLAVTPYRQRWSYRAFIVCTRCGAALEF